MVELTTDSKSNNPLAPVIGLSFFAIASGFLMSLIPLSLNAFNINLDLAPWLASVFYLGLLIGALCIERVVVKIGHRLAFIGFLALLIISVIAQLISPTATMWLIARFVAGMAVAGVFVVVESWLLMANTAKARAKRLGLYMTSLYGGSAVGQLAIKPLGTTDAVPYLFVIALLAVAILAPLLITRGQPDTQNLQKLALKELKTLSRPAILGCLVSGLLLGPIYGLLPVYIAAQTDQAQYTGLLMAVIILGGMLVQPLVSYLSTRIIKSLLMAIFCFIGTASVVGILHANNFAALVSSYFILGACSLALYPIAITLACDSLPMAKIVSATEIMLLSYSVGSVLGPLMATYFSDESHGVLIYLGGCLITTCIYMLIKSMKKIPTGNTPVAG
ncbi:MFS transporter [Pseudoalteromonas sp. 2CM39R]|uniref:MFS transporter n=1 Tax=Pseudoalteromonas sp. 2CM39R TaxID=2929856 RepID=UPI0020BEBBBD|nr:MFS transporter [Pseudoalteromonas sp. 2CM39R]MCK8128575.1 MFS transporter [Pseudoalteromonas sp. 2CM39R]